MDHDGRILTAREEDQDAYITNVVTFMYLILCSIWSHDRCLVTHKVYKYSLPPKRAHSTTTHQTLQTATPGQRGTTARGASPRRGTRTRGPTTPRTLRISIRFASRNIPSLILKNSNELNFVFHRTSEHTESNNL